MQKLLLSTLFALFHMTHEESDIYYCCPPCYSECYVLQKLIFFIHCTFSDIMQVTLSIWNFSTWCVHCCQ